ncbi:MAG: transcription termination factor NusA [Oscillospiraceae bacterium]|jgi:N utilization substance protein A|nr:transcription termination factor NusA [Oscillospiraceae bacterium]
MAAKRKGKSQEDTGINKEFFEALEIFERERGIPVSYMIEKIKRAIVAAVKGANNGNDDVVVNIEPDNYEFSVFIRQTVAETVDEKSKGHKILPEQAQKYDKKAEIGDVVNVRLEPKQFGRIAAMTAKHVIRQGIRDMEREQVYLELKSKNQEIVTGTVERIDPKSGAATIKIGKVEVSLPKNEQVSTEHISEGNLIKVFVVDVRELENTKENDRIQRATISRTHPGLVKRLFETEVPEIFDGTVEIKAVSREAGSRTKLAVLSNDENVDPVGACIGPKGSRVNSIVDELGGEKIDIIKYSEDPAEFIAKALSPANVISVTIDEEIPKNCRVVVPDDQLSLAIGNKGQNARLAARLTGWKIDIRPESKAHEE